MFWTRSKTLKDSGYASASVTVLPNNVHQLKCSGCKVPLEEGEVFEDRLHFCSLCMSAKCCTEFKRS